MMGQLFRRVGSDRVDPVLVILWAALVLIALIWIMPFVFIIFTALKDNEAITSGSPFAIPSPPVFENFPQAWDVGRFSTTALNSLIITVIKVPLGLALSAMAAFALARIEFKGSRIALLLIVFGTMIPFQVMLSPIFRVVNSIGLINTYWGVLFPYLAFGVPYQVFILYGFFKDVPKELSEAARIDGASPFTTFRRIFLPICLPVLAALFILDFVATWNEFAMALVILQSKDMWTLPLGLMGFRGQFSNSYGGLNAAITMTVFPAVIVYLMFQRYFVSGLTSGSIKE
jgi:raffinose/stachyose/melibiose transport system permease protein